MRHRAYDRFYAVQYIYPVMSDGYSGTQTYVSFV